MKKTFTSTIYLVNFLIIWSGCIEDQPNYFNYNDYPFSQLDELGGTWKPILLERPDQIVIQPPYSTQSTDYRAELDEAKSQIATMTRKEKDIVTYWTNNPVLRWNEIALEMAAKYNLIPGPNDDGTYTLPTPANPAGPPAFPFAHPPYTSRMLAYLSVAQFDGLIASWHYKFEFDRPSPYQVDETVHSSYQKSTLPSYPSDGAVVAIISRDILSAMFPLEKDFLENTYQEHIKSLVHSGTNVGSDVQAGQALGAEIAKLALQRASTDGMSRAQTPKPVSDSIKNVASERFGWVWENQESPVRPVGLTPLFGKVKMWNVPTVEEVRPGPPPAPGSAEFLESADELKKYANNLTVNQRKIANWWQDGLGTYTPPGHWNKFAKESIVKNKLNPLRSARVFAYMNTAIMDAGISCWDTKYYYHYPRPIQTIPGFKTILGTPNFPAYTSGHSTFSAAGAEVLSYFFPDESVDFRKKAQEAADSRVFGGIHYRFDSEIGLQQGKNVGSYAVNRAKLDGAQ